MASRSRSRGWCFTINGFFPNDVLFLREQGRAISDERSGTKVVYLVFGRELGKENRRRHLQGYIYFKNGIGFKKAKACISQRAHVEPARGTPRDNEKYCKKDGDWEEFGDVPQRGKRTDLHEIRDLIKNGVSDREIAEQYFPKWVVFRRSFCQYRELLREPVLRLQLRVYLLIGAAGVGKTRFAYERGMRDGGVWMSHDPTLKWFDGYDGQKHAIIDDFRGGSSFEWLLRLLDVYPLRVPVKGSFVDWTPEIIWITSNEDVERWYPDQADYSPLKRRIAKKAIIHNAGTYEEVETFLNKALSLI